MTIAPRDKQRVLDRLFKLRIRGLNVAVLRAIFGYIHAEHGVAWAKYCRYAEKSGRSERVVQRTVKTACDYLILRRAYREGAPAIWCPELMDMEPEDAVRRVDALADSYNKAKVATPTSSTIPAPHPVDHPAPSVASTTDPAGYVPASGPSELASKLAPHPTPDWASKSASDSAPLKPQEVNPKQKNEEPSCAVTPPRGGGAWRTTRLAPASSQAHDLAVKIGKLCGLGDRTYEWSKHWRREAPHIVQSWLTDQGWHEDHIIGVVWDVIKKASEWSPPESIRYFEKPIMRLYAQLAAQIAEVQRSRSRLERE